MRGRLFVERFDVVVSQLFSVVSCVDFCVAVVDNEEDNVDIVVRQMSPPELASCWSAISIARRQMPMASVSVRPVVVVVVVVV